MPEPREYQTEAIVIRKMKLGEADSKIASGADGRL